MKPLLSTAIASLLLCTPALAADLYVATDGSDAWTGKRAEPNAGRTDGPFATLERARDEVRKLKGGKAGGITVHIRGGVYVLEKPLSLSAADSGSAKTPITYRAYRDEQVTLTGGKEVTGFKPYRDEILQCDVKTLGLEKLKPVTADRNEGDVPACELFVAGKRMDLARWPNHFPDHPRGGEWTYIAAAPETGSRTQFSYLGDRPRNWKRPEEAQVHLWPWWDWFDQYVGIQAIDAEKGEITLASPTHYALQPYRRFYVRNVFEELDAPGEWYLDRKAGTLYFYPPAPGEQGKVYVSVLNNLVTLKDAAYVTLRDLTLECCRGTAVAMNGGTHSRVAGCVIRNTGTGGISITGGTANGAVGNDIYDTGRGGISLAGGDRASLTPAKHYADNNHIHHYGRVLKTYQPAVAVNGVGNRVSHNLIHDAPHTAIQLNGNDHLVEFNDIHHVCQETADAGAFYTGRDWTYRGNVLRYNRIHDVYGYGLERVDAARGLIYYRSPLRAQGIYLDDGTSGFHVYGNILYRIGDMMVQVGGGRDNRVENNIFVDGRVAVGIDARWPTYPWEEHNVRRLKDVPYQTPPWSTRYPDLAKPMRNHRWPEGNKILRNIAASLGEDAGDFTPFRYAIPQDATEIDRNLVWNSGERVLVVRSLLHRELRAAHASLGWDKWQGEGFDVHSLNADPRFVDPASDDYRLRPDSPAFRLGFKKIPVEEIGLYKDDLRASWPVPADNRRGSLEPVVQAFPVRGVGPTPADAAVFSVPRISRPGTIDGTLAPGEWGGAAEMALEQDINGAPARPRSQARLSWDDDYLYIAVRNEVNPNEPLKTGSTWGTDDAIEVAIRNPAAEKDPPIAVLRGYANGYFRSTTDAGAPYELVIRMENEAEYEAKIVDSGLWTAEWKIPLAALGFNPDRDSRLDLNITVRKTGPPLWLMWRGTRGNSWLLDRAGVILLRR
jgi:parallel beta helix pectate lyase-like protein/cellulose/xylan binding protein with CBM9 domain